jgi:hypothetical protein
MACNDESLLASPCGINGDVSRDTPALAFGVNYSVFKEPLSDHAGHPLGVPPLEGPQAPDRHSPLASFGATQVSEDLWVGPARGVRVNASGASTGGGPRIVWAECRTCNPFGRISGYSGLASPPMGSSGMKRKGRKHQPKVGTKQERDYALHEDQRAVMANMGVRGKGAAFWIAIVLIVAIVVVAVGSLALFF